MKRLTLLIGLLLVSCQLSPGTSATSSPAYYSLELPQNTSEAKVNQQPVPMLFLTLRLADESNKRRVLFSEEDETIDLAHDETASMTFLATAPFKSVGAFVTASGNDSHLSLTLQDEVGKTITATRFDKIADRTWVDLATPTGTPGRYTLVLKNEGQETIGWRGKRAPSELAAVDQQVTIGDSAIPFLVKRVPQYTNSSVKIPVGAKVEEFYFLGGTSSYDQGSGWWGDSETQQDYSEKQFIGDEAGNVRIIYTDGTVDTIPIIFGWNIWWYNPYDRSDGGGPYLEPFASDPKAADVLKSSLRLTPATIDPLTRYYWSYQPKPVDVSAIELVDNPEKRGFPIISAVTVKSANQGDFVSFQSLNGNLTSTPVPSNETAITPKDVTKKTYESPLNALRHVLYMSNSDINANQLPDSTSKNQMASFQGPVTATILTRVFADNVDNLFLKMDDNGTFHSSENGSPNYGGYVGIGTWRNGFGLFYAQSWTRDMGRALLEALQLGQLPKAEMGIKFADSHLYDLPNGFPKINRAGQKVPAHWATIVQDPLYMDTDGQGDGNQENDGHGLMLLAHYRAWEQKARDQGWLKDRWPFIKDAANWFIFEMDNPSFSRADGVLYSESESADEKGYDVYSNFIAVKALEKSALMAEAMGDNSIAEKWRSYALKIRKGMIEKLTTVEPQFGRTWNATAWNWAYANESLAPLIILADTDGYSIQDTDGEFSEITRNTYARQVTMQADASAPRILGYGQGFLTQAALLADDVPSYSNALANLARYIYSPRMAPYIVPEGVIVDPTGEYWYRDGDLGNAVQQAEVLKALALIIGIDNNTPRSLSLVPRLPQGWSGIKVQDYPLPSLSSSFSYQLERIEQGIHIRFEAKDEIPLAKVRLGPIPKNANPALSLNGIPTVPTSVEVLGDWQWVWTPDIEKVKSGDVEVSW